MRKTIMSSVMLLSMALVGGKALNAQAPDQGQGPRPHGQFRGGMNPEFETRMLTRRLNLTPEQAAQIEPILAEQHERMKALKPAEGSTPDFKAMREQHKAIMEETQQKLAGILTPEQLAKMHEHKGGPHGGPRGNWKGGAAPATPSAPAE